MGKSSVVWRVWYQGPGRGFIRYHIDISHLGRWKLYHTRLLSQDVSCVLKIEDYVYGRGECKGVCWNGNTISAVELMRIKNKVYIHVYVYNWYMGKSIWHCIKNVKHNRHSIKITDQLPLKSTLPKCVLVYRGPQTPQGQSIVKPWTLL